MLGGLPSTTTYLYDDANRLTSVNGVTYTWDANGNTSTSSVQACSMMASTPIPEIALNLAKWRGWACNTTRRDSILLISMNCTLILSILAIFLGAFTQSLTGFGVALVSMAILPSLLGLQVATPLVALTGVVLEAMMLARYRESLQIGSIWRLLAASLAAIPFCVFFLRQLDERIALTVLGAVIAGYAMYALIGLRLPELRHPLWAWLTGLASGLLGGAYNTAGPPVVIYGNCRGWSPQEFKSNLSGFFVVNSLMVVTTHFLSGNYTPVVMKYFWWTLPALGLGFLAGQSLDRWLSPESFRKIVLVMLVVLGIRMAVS